VRLFSFTQVSPLRSDSSPSAPRVISNRVYFADLPCALTSSSYDGVVGGIFLFFGTFFHFTLSVPVTAFPGR